MKKAQITTTRHECTVPYCTACPGDFRLRVQACSPELTHLALHSSILRAGRDKASAQRAMVTIPLRAEVKFDTCAQLSEAGS